ncbi:MAG: MBL fold metallo-hydrolase [Pseudomonadota bacterium]
MQIGPYKLSSVETGEFSLDGGAMFGTVPRVLWEKTNPPDGKNRIRLAMRALLLEGEGRKILVDCGVGDKGGEKFRDMYNVDVEAKNVGKSLAALGLTPADITDVVITHFHFDHGGGATRRTADGTYTATFPNATYYIQARNLAVAQAPNPREKASYLKESFEALLREKRLRSLRGPEKVFPLVELFVSFGHTEAQQHVQVSDGRTTLFYAADLIPTSAHVPIPWIMGYDLQPLKMLEEKEKVLSLAKTTDFVLFYEHDPKIAAARIVAGERGWTAGESVEI